MGAAKKIALNPTLGGFTPKELMDVFGTKNSCRIFLSVSPVDAIQKILDYEFERHREKGEPMMDENENAVQLYTSFIRREDGELEVDGYAYGAPWVEQALSMDDIKFDTPEEAKAWWEKNYG